ncbi:MAG: G1 family glutamic endopeptidase [Caulobacteraceae bacterium]|jgi:hypothetical protein
MSNDHTTTRERNELLAKKLPFPIIPTAIEGVYTSPPWPKDFDIATATDSELKRHGIFFRRPGPTDDPRLHEAWKLATSRVWRPEDRLTPIMKVQEGRTHLRGPVTRGEDGTYYGGGWSGGAVKGKWSGVIGQWKIPTVYKPREPAGEDGGWTSSSWVGLDGAYTSNDVLQAGVAQQVDGAGKASYVAWYEWYAPSTPTSPPYIWQINITNMPVSAGDVMFCSVQYLGTTAGHLWLMNVTTGKQMSITLAPPPGATFDGESAEWIMECNDGAEPSEALPGFTPIDFTGCVACGPSVASVTPAGGDVFVIVDGQGTPLTSTALGQGVVIDFIG